MSKKDDAAGAGFVLAILVLAFYVGLLYVLVHFVRKFW